MELIAARNRKFDEVAVLLEAFQGAVSLSDILNQDIPILEGLKEAKMRLIASRKQ